MVFSSLLFLCLFLPACLILYFAAPTIRVRNIVLTVLSLVFYAWGEPVYVLLLICSAALNYLAARLLSLKKGRKLVLVLSIVINLGILGFFKYAGFLADTFTGLTGIALAVPAVTLPIGISFYTFQAMSYVIDVYREDVPAQRNPLDFLLYLALFPQLIAGPIVRYSEIAKQIEHRHHSPDQVFYGMTRFCIGLGKKVLIANQAGNVADGLLGGSLGTITTTEGWLGIVMFAFQLYFDFSGYSDMAIGLGRIFGFRYGENFRHPYESRSITELWRRWHISLGSFFRDYVYIPLGGSRRHQVLNMLVVWALTGLWHGASWNFVLWGLYFFVLLFIEKKITLKRLEKLPDFLRHFGTIFLILIGWVLFYFTDLSRAGQAYSVLFGFGGSGLYSTSAGIQLLNRLPLLLLGVIASTSFPGRLGLLLETVSIRGKSWRRYAYVIGAFLFDLVLLLLSVISLVGSSFNPFLYFRF